MALTASQSEKVTRSFYNTQNNSVKRLMREAMELKDPNDLFYCQPIENNLYEWHFTIRGPKSTEFEHGIYHGRIIFPPEYPMKPPSIIFLTASGRFAVNEKICLSISNHHVETWTPTWGIRTALLAIIGFMETPGEGAVGSLDYTPDERRTLAQRSQSYECPICRKPNSELLLPWSETSIDIQNEAKMLANQINFRKTLDTKPNVSTTVKPKVNPSEFQLPPTNRTLSLNQNNSNSILLSALIFLCCVAFLFLLMRRIFLVLDNHRPNSWSFGDL